jgi:hypothetical protein
MRHHAVQLPTGRHRVTGIVAESLKLWTHLPHQAVCAGSSGLSKAREQTGDNLMGKELKYQLRLTLSDPFAKVARNHPDDPSIASLTQVLQRHEAALKCQYDAFADYVREAEAEGVERYPLYAWTKKTVDDPVKEAKYTKSFTLYVGGAEVYERSKADALEAELKPLVGGPIVAQMLRYDTDPAHSPHPPQGKNE